jgi:soluble lytic murein transglycosylase-like protein
MSAETYWLDVGAVVRCLVRVPTRGQLPDSHNVVQLLASAPEGAVSAADEADEAVAEAARQAKLDAAARRQTRIAVEQDTRYEATSANRSGSVRAPLAHGHPIAILRPEVLSVYDAYRAAVAKMNPRLHSADLDKITSSLLYYSDYNHIDPRLIFAMIIAESGFDPNCTSRTGAMGLGQLMPGTASGLGISDAYDPVQNIGAAVHILSSNVRRYGGTAPSGVVPVNTLILTMAAYNAGSGAVKRYGGVPPYRETRAYVRRVAAFYKQLCRAD